MKETISIDKAGRVVLPKALRDRFRLREGDSLSLEVKGDAIELRPSKSAKIVRVNGVLVYADSARLPVGIDFTAESRDERISDLISRDQE
jgi:AbrB family looped-hinge helix DNA binding protein